MSKIGTLDPLRAILHVAAVTNLQMIFGLYRARVLAERNERVPNQNCSEIEREVQGRKILEAPSLLPTAATLWADVRRPREPTDAEALQQPSCNVDVELASIARFVSNRELGRQVSGFWKGVSSMICQLKQHSRARAYADRQE